MLSGYSELNRCAHLRNRKFQSQIVLHKHLLIPWKLWNNLFCNTSPKVSKGSIQNRNENTFYSILKTIIHSFWKILRQLHIDLVKKGVANITHRYRVFTLVSQRDKMSVNECISLITMTINIGDFKNLEFRSSCPSGLPPHFCWAMI